MLYQLYSSKLLFIFLIFLSTSTAINNIRQIPQSNENTNNNNNQYLLTQQSSTQQSLSLAQNQDKANMINISEYNEKQKKNQNGDKKAFLSLQEIQEKIDYVQKVYLIYYKDLCFHLQSFEETEYLFPLSITILVILFYFSIKNIQNHNNDQYKFQFNYEKERERQKQREIKKPSKHTDKIPSQILSSSLFLPNSESEDLSFHPEDTSKSNNNDKNISYFQESSIEQFQDLTQTETNSQKDTNSQSKPQQHIQESLLNDQDMLDFIENYSKNEQIQQTLESLEKQNKIQKQQESKASSLLAYQYRIL